MADVLLIWSMFCSYFADLVGPFRRAVPRPPALSRPPFHAHPPPSQANVMAYVAFLHRHGAPRVGLVLVASQVARGLERK